MPKLSATTPPKSQKTKPVKSSAKKPAKSNKENVEAGEDTKTSRVVVSWAKPEHFHMTDALLTLIEDSVTWKGALGFDIGAISDPTPTGKGKSLIQHCADIAVAFFITGDKDSKWVLDDIKMLKFVIKNRVSSLKSTFHALRQELGETGHGLVISGCDEDLREGSEVANVWEDIQKKFPWYIRMAALIGGSPNYSRKGVSNSQSALDLSVLGTENLDYEDETMYRTPTPFEDEDAPDRSSVPPSPPAMTDEKEDARVREKLTLTIPSKRATDSLPVPQSAKKRKTPQDLVKEVADAERQARLTMNETNAKERTVREQIKRQSAHDTALAVERLRLKVQQEQAMAQRAHELLMIDKQIELARLQHGGSLGVLGTIDPQLRG
ncbi:hypothetical protein BU15DRAFT_81515 [Melanogaster broomeanus]|nr:hypothetical protein BU15DRAFT_81515 [Melanogaster broomeanus]